MLIHTKSYARAGLIGNPSDGYFGKTISFTFREFCAEVTMYETPEMGFIPAEVDDSVFKSPDELIKDIQLFGYYGGIRLLKATAKLFFIYCRENGLQLPSRNFTVRYTSNIPRLVGLSGSSAICTAMLKALQCFYEVSLPKEWQPTLCLKAEREELGIQCGLQDRVIQIYQGLVFMDFDKVHVEEYGYGRYEMLDSSVLKNLYISYDPLRAEVSGVYHQKLRILFEEKKPDILAAMTDFADLAQQARDVIVGGRLDQLPSLMNAHFDLRDRIFNVSEANRQMVMTARSVGCSAKFAGSGGAILGMYEDESHYQRLVQAMALIGCTTLKTSII
jgi:glucuronokinase